LKRKLLRAWKKGKIPDRYQQEIILCTLKEGLEDEYKQMRTEDE
jgi:hypothetical protein